MKIHLPSTRCVLTILLLVTACQSTDNIQTAAPAILPTSTDAPAPTVAVTPSPAPPVFKYPNPEWNGVQLKGICIQFGELYDVQSPYANLELHQARIEKLLEELDLPVSDSANGCDVTLHIDAGYFVSSSSYSSQSTGSTFDCVTDFGFNGVMVLTTDTLPVLYTTVSNETGNAPYITFDGCPDQSILFDIAWSQGVLEGLSRLFGPSIITSLYKSKDEIHRNAAYGASRALGPEDTAILPDVIEALKVNTDVQVRSQIASGIQNMGSEAQKASSVIVPQLLDDLKTSATDPVMPGLLDQTIVGIFEKLGPGAKDAIPTLLKMADDPNRTVSSDLILQAIASMGPEAVDAVPTILEQARNGGAYSLEALGKLGPVTPEVVPALMEIAQNYKQNYWLSAVAMESLGRMAPQSPEVLPFLLSAAQDGNTKYKALGLRGLGLANTASPEVFRVLEQSLSHTDDSVRVAAIDALKELGPGFGPEVRDTIPMLIAIAQKQDSFSLAPHSAIDALSVIGNGSPEVSAAFNDLLLTNHVLTDFAVESLGPESHELIPALVETLDVNQIGGPQDIASLTSYIKALIAITGEYPGYRAQDWKAWLDTQPN